MFQKWVTNTTFTIVLSLFLHFVVSHHAVQGFSGREHGSAPPEHIHVSQDHSDRFVPADESPIPSLILSCWAHLQGILPEFEWALAPVLLPCRANQCQQAQPPPLQQALVLYTTILLI